MAAYAAPLFPLATPASPSLTSLTPNTLQPPSPPFSTRLPLPAIFEFPAASSASPRDRPSTDTTIISNDGPAPASATSALHPRVAVVLGVDRRWHIPLLTCRALSVLAALWWGLRCALTFLAELVLADGAWTVEKRFRVTEVLVSILWVSAIDSIFTTI